MNNLPLLNACSWRFPEAADWLAWLGCVGSWLLVITPGAWIAFGFPLRNVAFGLRLCLAAVLSPLLVGAEFYALRLAGLPFRSTAVLLVFLNLPAVWLIWRRRSPLAATRRGDWLVVAAALIVPILGVGSVLTDNEARMYSGHSWLHADAVNLLMRGNLDLEDPTLAGVRMSYPVWTGLPYEAVHAYLTQSPAQMAYIWSDLVFLVAVCGFASGIARELGAGKSAQAASAILLLLGTNPVGYALAQLIPLHSGYQLWGDERYTPWVNKFQLFTPMTLGLAIGMAILLLLVRPGRLGREALVLLAVLLCGIGLFYPLLFPSACGFLGARALADGMEEPGWSWKASTREVLALCGIVALASLLTYAEVRFLTIDRHSATATVVLSKFPSAMRKAFEAAVAVSLLLAGVALAFRRIWARQRRATVVLLAGAAASYFLYVVFFIPYYENEYKFVFAIAMCLAVFPALAAERIWHEWPRSRAVPVLAFAALLTVGAYALWSYRNWPAPWLGAHGTTKSYAQTYHPPLQINGVDLELGAQDERFGICNAVRTRTPQSAILLVDDSAIYYPGLASRSLYVSAESRSYPGVNQWADELEANVRGYGPQILAERRAILHQFFDPSDLSSREGALRSIQALHRPIAVLADPAHPDLLHWLQTDHDASERYAENGRSLWLIEDSGSRK